MEYYPACLCHHGVKGMKWGVRRKLRSKARVLKRRLSSGFPINRNAKKIKVTKTKSSSSESLVSEDYKKGHSKKPVNQLSNDELKAIVDRLTIENNYNEQLRKQKGKDASIRAIESLEKINRGLTVVSNVANNVDNIYSKASKYYDKSKKK